MTIWAVLSDIHGNLPALHAVLADAKAQGANGWLNLGDTLSGPLWPRETAELLMTLDMQHIAGNHERQLLTQHADAMNASDRFAAAHITPAQREWLAAMPKLMRPQEGLLCVHGNLTSDNEYLLETVTADHGVAGSKGVRQASEDELRQRLAPLPATLLLCGHSHVPRQVLFEGLHIANPGSVGLPAFDHDQPHLHDVETGSPRSRYALVRRFALGWLVTLREVDYDWDSAAQRAAGNGRDDWADALRSGRVGRRAGSLQRP